MNEGVLGHDAGSLSALDRQAISHIPPGGNWRNIPVDFPSDRVRQIREGAALGTGTRSSTGEEVTYSPAADLPAMSALDPLADLPPKPGPAEPCRFVFTQGASVKRWSVGIPFASPRWWWNADGPYENAIKAEFNPGNTINTEYLTRAVVGEPSGVAAMLTKALRLLLDLE